MLDPEKLTFAQWFWICFALVLAIFFLCRCIDINTEVGPLGFLPVLG
ncbi:MAG: hypothetical protein BWY75_00230 [bacterium ADurb.Bin425]|nr:MAG: hypothetical protein BWY75_00230 [bacterium ADurb.Bin425]